MMLYMAKIVIDARESGTSTGRYVDKLIEYLHKIPSDHEMIVLTKKHRTTFMRGIAPGFSVVETPYNEFGFGEQTGLLRQIKSLKPDLVHFAIVQQPVLYHGRVVTTMHDLTTIRFKNPSKNSVVFTFKQFVYGWVNKIAAKKSTAVIAISEYTKNDVVQYTGVSPSKVHVILESADKIKEPSEPVKGLGGKKFIMYVGRPTPHKNLGRLIEAFSVLQKDQPDLHLVLAGKKDSLYEAHERTVHEKNIQNVIFTGFISEGQLRWLYENTACYVFPSLSEGFGLPGLEAMIHGTPVASSNATCLPEIYGDAAEYFDPLDSRGMAAAIANVLSNPELKNKLIKRGHTQVAKYSWQRMANQTFDIYQDVLS